MLARCRHWGAAKAQPRVVEALVQGGALVNAADRDGDTALVRAQRRAGLPDWVCMGQSRAAGHMRRARSAP